MKKKKNRNGLRLLGMTGAAAVLFLTAVGVGSVQMSIADVVAILRNGLFGAVLPENISSLNASILMRIRLPRVCMAFLCGAMLSISGAVMQSVLRNPLASSYTLGVSSGASLGAAFVLLLGVQLPLIPTMTLPAAGFVLGLAAVLAAVLMVYTGLYLAWMEAVPLWNNAALPALFALSSFSSGAAIVLLLVPYARDWALLSGWIDGLHRAHLAALGLEFLALVAFVALAATNPFAGSSLVRLVSPAGQGPWFIAGFVLGGIVVPFGAEAARPFTGRTAPVAAAEVLCLFGGLILRFCLVLAGSHWLG